MHHHRRSRPGSTAGAVPTAAVSTLVLLLGACAVEGSDAASGDGGDDPTCTGDKCDELGDQGRTGKRIANPCPVQLAVGVVDAGTDQPDLVQTIPPGGSAWFPTLQGDRFVITDIGGIGWRTVAHVGGAGPVALDPGYCPWDVFIESGTVTEKAADGRDWDPYLVGDYRLPDPYAWARTDGGKDDCKGYPTVGGLETSTADDTTAPSWDQETLSFVAWHDMSWGLDVLVIDDDAGPAGEAIGGCRFDDLPTPDRLPAVVTSDCGGGGSFTIRIEPADDRPVQTVNVPVGGACG